MLSRKLFVMGGIESETLELLNSFRSSFDVQMFDSQMNYILAHIVENVCRSLTNYVLGRNHEQCVILIEDFDLKLPLPKNLENRGPIDGFSEGYCAVIRQNYPEVVAHELLHAAFGVDDCYDEKTLDNLRSCDDSRCVMRYGNKQGIHICSSIRHQVNEFESQFN